MRGRSEARATSWSAGPAGLPAARALSALSVLNGAAGTVARVIVDTGGLNTQATVKNTDAIFQQLHASRILVVSHFYHLPRIKLAYQRAGWDVYTVPAKETYVLRQTPYNIAREVAALWVYYLRPLSS